MGLFLRDYRTGIRKKIEAIPSSLEKAKAGLWALIHRRGEVSYGPAVYEACVLLAHTIEEQRIQDIIADWSKERRSLEERDPTVENLRSRKMFWRLGSQDFTEDGISRYRFREKFDVTGFDSAFEVFESEMSDALCEPVSGSDVHRLAMELSSLSRSRTLVARLRLAVDIGLRRLVESSGTVCWLQPRGLPTEGMVQIPSVATTAYATSALLMLGTSDIQRDVGLRGMRWLLEQQSGDGHWTNDSSSGRSTSGIPDIEITTACINALLKSGLPRISRSLNLAQTWLISQQNALGFWEQRGTDFVLLTVSVLETLERVAKRPSKVAEPLVSAAQGFMSRASQLAFEANPTSRRLSAIAAHQGLEAFMYAVLNHLHLNMWRDKNETIGLRSALRLYEDYLKSHKSLKQNAILPNRNSLDSLAHLRDEVIHKGLEPSRDSLEPLINIATQFVEDTSITTFGYNILE